jgi:hypothetical protein
VYWLLTLIRAEARPLFPDDLAPALFLERFLRLGLRWDVTLRGFALGGRQARLLVHGSDAAVGHVCRLQQSGWGVWRYHQGDFLAWEPAVRERVGGPRLAVHTADLLHRATGLGWPWSSLRDALGLRSAGWVDPAWLRHGRSPAQVLGAAVPGVSVPVVAPISWRAVEPLAWPVVEGALRHVTGRDPSVRTQRGLRSRVAWSAGWSVPEIAAHLDVQARTVARALRHPAGPALPLVRTLLHDLRLRPVWLLGVGEWATAPGLEVPCLATPRSWSELAG